MKYNQLHRADTSFSGISVQELIHETGSGDCARNSLEWMVYNLQDYHFLYI